MASESSEQIEIVRRLRRAGLVLAAVPNGGRRARQEAGRLKREGVTPGVPDLLIFDGPDGLEAASEFERELVGCLQSLTPSARARVLALAGCGPGAALEMKRVGGGRVSAKQQQWGELLRARGWRWEVAHGWRAALDHLRAWGYKV